MDLKTIKENYPIRDTLVGYYYDDGDFVADCYDDVKNIDRWEYAPLDWCEGAFPFIVYDGNIFTYWIFNYSRVSGYYTEDGEHYKLVTYSRDNGYEVIDALTSDYTILKPDIETYGDKAIPYENMLEVAAKTFSPTAYEEGRILTTYDDVKIFCSKLEENK